MKHFLKSPHENEPPDLRIQLQAFVHGLQSKEMITWATLFNSNVQEFINHFNNFLASRTSNTSVASTSSKSGIPTSSTPSTSNRPEDNQFKKFSPLVDIDSKIKCTVGWCSSTFGYKRSYEAHMLNAHPSALVDLNVKEPLGTCRLLNKTTGLPCEAKLSLSSMYGHLLRKHNTRRPSKHHTLAGFKIGPNPSAVFVTKNSNLELDKAAVKSNFEDIDLSKKEKEKFNPEEVIHEELLTKTDDFEKEKKGFEKKKVTDEEDFNKPQDKSYHEVENLHVTESSCDASSIVNDFTEEFPKSPPVLVPILGVKTKRNLDDFDDTTPMVKKRKFSRKLLNKVDKALKNIEKVKIPKQKKAPLVKISKFPEDCSSSSDEYTVEKSSEETEKIIYDSDYESDDTLDFTNKRTAAKAMRHLSRNENCVNSQESTENSQFIADMISYMKTESISTKNLDKSTIQKTVSELFTKEDSFLNFNIKKDRTFNLNRLRKFNEDDYIGLVYPIEWLTETCLEEGIKGQERLKAHTQLRRFIDYEVENADSSLEFLPLKMKVKENNASITLQISKNNLYRKYTELAKAEHQKKEKCKLILDRSKIHKEQNILVKWNSSQEKEEKDKDMENIYNESMSSGVISPRNLTAYSEYARLQLAFTDKNRPGVYGFREAFKKKQKKFGIFKTSWAPPPL